MKTFLTCNLSDNTALVGDDAWQPSALTFNETLTVAMRFTRTVAGQTIEPNLTINSLIASLGFVDERPLRGKWALQIGPGAQTSDNTTAEISYNASPKELENAINALAAVVTAYGAATVRFADGSWYIVFATATAAVPLAGRNNSLFPISFGQCNAELRDGKWHHEVRLIQMPCDSTTNFARVLPPPPTIAEVQLGGSAGGVQWNEIQRLYVRPDFRATYYLRFGYARTEHLSKDDGPDEVLAALVAALGSNFSATLSADYTIDIEFTGDYAGDAQPLLEVVPVDPPPGDLTFTLPLNRGALLTWLRVSPLVTLPLEVKIGVTEDDEESTLVPVRVNLSIQRPLNWLELEEVANVDWLRPASPIDYIPRSTSTVFTGEKGAAYRIGDGTATVFAIGHPFATEDLVVAARENVTNGRQLVDGADYTVRITNANSVTVTALLGAPTASPAGWLVFVRALEPIAAFADGLEITVGQVIGLEDRLSAAETAIRDLQTLVPTGTLARPETTATPTVIEIPDHAVIFPNAKLAVDVDAGALLNATAAVRAVFPTARLRPPGLLPAIRSAAPTNITEIPSNPTTGTVYKNNGSDDLYVPGGLGRRGEVLRAGEYAGWDGRTWYHMTRGSAGSEWYFPTDFEQELMEPLTFEVDTWRPGQTFELTFDLVLMLVRANTNLQWVLVIELGYASTQTATVGSAINLTTAGTGTQTLTRDGTVLGTFTANASTDFLTLSAPAPADGTVVRVSNAGGVLPAGLVAGTDYVVRDGATPDFKLALLAGPLNLEEVVWSDTPLLTQRLTVSQLKQTRGFGCRVLRSTTNVLTAEALKHQAWFAADAAPATAQMAIRVRMVRADTQNSVTGATGYALAALLNAKASIT